MRKAAVIKNPGRQSRASGQALVEMALALPFLLIALVAIIYFGRAFYTKQILSYAAQEGARAAARIPNLSDPSVRDTIRGFTTDGALVGNDDPSTNPSPIYRALSAAHMLSGADRAHGDLPPGASIEILPWDEGGGSTTDTVTVQIKYPFGLMVDTQTGKGSDTFGDSVNISLGGGSSDGAVSFANGSISEAASAAQEIYQQ